MSRLRKELIRVPGSEEQNTQLAVQLRNEGEITTPGRPFEASDIQEIETLIGRGVFSFEKYNREKHGND
ncbi:hypothetical protein F5B19DRAFT_441366 [Rostrohypoxylon terebratum]|nr:hypothetical protein F5B19DRAFT_441366 [Rostrohypoxylon terebratum]